MGKVTTSQYLADEFCEQLKEMLRGAMQRHVEGKPLPKFWATHTEIEEVMFLIIDKALEDYVEDMGEEIGTTEIPEDILAYKQGEHRG